MDLGNDFRSFKNQFVSFSLMILNKVIILGDKNVVKEGFSITKQCLVDDFKNQNMARP